MYFSQQNDVEDNKLSEGKVSIIERAANRLGKNTATARTSETTEDINVSLPSERVEAKIEAKQEEADKEGANKESSNDIIENKQIKSDIVATTQKQILIDLDRLHQLGVVTPMHGKTQIAEQFRLIKRPLLVNAFNQHTGIKNGNLIMITSSLAGEGKSFCSINLAMSIAMEMDHRVLLVDADVARPSIPKILDFNPERKGLLDIILDDQLDVSNVLIKTNIDKLTIISAGTRHPHATELLASQSMGAILTELAQRYRDRIVIFDSPPLLLASEARVLASQMGQIVLVVEAERTTHQTLKEALRQIESCDVVNLVYNKARAFPGAGYYGYYYS